jgi:hypothetical protein
MRVEDGGRGSRLPPTAGTRAALAAAREGCSVVGAVTSVRVGGEKAAGEMNE